jgi:SAM-dependent methyltransferase
MVGFSPSQKTERKQTASMGSTSTWLLHLSRIMSVMRPRRTGRGWREPDVPFQPTPRQAVKQMLLLGGVQRGDVLYDLGCGDGGIPITAAQLYGARGVGIDIDPVRIDVSRRSARKEGVLGRVTFRNEDLFEADISEATVVTLFLWPEVTRALRQKLLRDLRPGTRVVSYFWEIADWVPDRETAVDGRPIYLWTILPRRLRPVGPPPEPSLARALRR